MMSPATPLRYLLLLGWVATMSVATPARAADETDPPPDFPTLQRHWKAWRSQFATIRVRGRHWDAGNVFKYNPTVDASNDQWRTSYVLTDEFLWSDIGAKRHESVQIQAGAFHARHASGCDGKVGWIASATDASNPAHWKAIQTYRPFADRPLKSHLVTTLVDPLWNPDGVWFDEYLASGETPRVLGWEEIDGVRCVVVSKPHPQRAEEKYWFDPTHGFLPTKHVRYERTGPSLPPSAPDDRPIGVFSTMRVVEFQQLHDQFWYPRRTVKQIRDNPPPGFEVMID